MMDMSKRVGPYVGVCRDQIITLDGRKFRILVYGAYDAGIIGSEYNGIAVLDEDNMCVVADNIEKADSGYFGPSRQQLALFDNMTSTDYTFDDLRKLVNASDRVRVPL